MATTARLLSIPALLLLAAAHGAAPAQSRPPIKAGLWEVKQTREMNGQKMPDMGEHLKNMPPEARKRMEEQMRQRGVEMGGGSTTAKLCLSEESLSRDDWTSAGAEHGCKTEILSRSATAWKWRSTCGGQPPTVAEGETRFQGDTGYTTVIDATSNRQGQPHRMHMEMQGKWLGADCGKLKPIVPPKAGGSNKP